MKGRLTINDINRVTLDYLARKRKRKAVTMKVGVPIALHEQLSRYSRAMGKPMAQIINLAIGEYFRRHPAHEVFDDIAPIYYPENNP